MHGNSNVNDNVQHDFYLLHFDYNTVAWHEPERNVVPEFGDKGVDGNSNVNNLYRTKDKSNINVIILTVILMLMI